ncbi:hypothetical protein J2I47_09365 [Fibrella sp. HMF5335]|uniref:DUF4149 domain-containing protein n=1 Tax=Fibrella rubiginis TaxID=2817060 RepID=A0A939GH85_9BACT|nr:hypothetical protein [Fibrella rubiginis]MBO0936750.1 hypothetical protein [Fibrella rubiginis]
MSRFRPVLYALGAVLFGHAGKAQSASPPPVDRLQFSQQRYNHTRTLGLSLGSYALANMAVSGIAAGQTTGEAHYFHQMNLYWNAVNLGIAGFGLLGLRKQNPETESLADAVQKHQAIKKTLLVNAGLDVVYVAGGLILAGQANAHPDQADKLRGYGKAVAVQGAFLLAFDLVNYLIFKHRGDPQQIQLTAQAPLGLGVRIPIR